MKLPDLEFQAGMEVWGIQEGFVLLEDFKDSRHPLKGRDWIYTKNGYMETNDTHRSLFTLEEAERLFGVKKEKKKVMYQALMANTLRQDIYFVSERLFKDEADATQYCVGLSFKPVKLLTDRPIEFEE